MKEQRWRAGEKQQHLREDRKGKSKSRRWREREGR